MKQFRHKARVVSIAVSSLIMALATGSPQVFAHGGTSTEAMEQQIKILENQLKAIRDELNQVADHAVLARVRSNAQHACTLPRLCGALCDEFFGQWVVE